MKRVFSVGLLILLFVLVLPVYGAAKPDQFVKETAETVLEKLKTEGDAIKNDPDRVNDIVTDMVLPHFDFERMSKWVLGKHWRRASDEQKVKFVKEFKVLLVRTYANSLSEYSDQEIHYFPFRGTGKEEEVTVKTEIDQPGGFPIPINYDLYRVNDAWKVVDVAIDGVSLVANYRSSFSAQIRKLGVDGLIAKLSEGNQR